GSLRMPIPWRKHWWTRQAIEFLGRVCNFVHESRIVTSRISSEKASPVAYIGYRYAAFHAREARVGTVSRQERSEGRSTYGDRSHWRRQCRRHARATLGAGGACGGLWGPGAP